jgi:beta-lactamase regulating signal transducer with metallopeptidase domain
LYLYVFLFVFPLFFSHFFRECPSISVVVLLLLVAAVVKRRRRYHFRRRMHNTGCPSWLMTPVAELPEQSPSFSSKRESPDATKSTCPTTTTATEPRRSSSSSHASVYCTFSHLSAAAGYTFITHVTTIKHVSSIPHQQQRH